MRISDWSSDVCSSVLERRLQDRDARAAPARLWIGNEPIWLADRIGGRRRAGARGCRARGVGGGLSRLRAARAAGDAGGPCRRRTQAIVRQNFAIAICYNIVAVPLAFMGYVTPLVAAIAMSGSSLIVVGNAMRLRGAAR